MHRLLVRLTAVLGLAAVATAAPMPVSFRSDMASYSLLSKRAFDCAKPVEGLSRQDCEHMSAIGIAGQGFNERQNTGKGIWVGQDGPNKFAFENKTPGRINVVVWNNPKGDYQSSFLNVRQPQISWSLAPNQKVTVSVAMDISGGFAAIYEQRTKLTEFGQLAQTWGEFTTGAYGTVDVSQEVLMGADPMEIKTPIGCVSNMDKCVFVCKDGKKTCGKPGEYELKNCVALNDPDPENRSQPNATPQAGATFGRLNGQPEGGCQGFDKGGVISVTFKT